MSCRNCSSYIPCSAASAAKCSLGLSAAQCPVRLAAAQCRSWPKIWSAQNMEKLRNIFNNAKLKQVRYFRAFKNCHAKGFKQKLFSVWRGKLVHSCAKSNVGHVELNKPTSGGPRTWGQFYDFSQMVPGPKTDSLELWLLDLPIIYH